MAICTSAKALIALAMFLASSDLLAAETILDGTQVRELFTGGKRDEIRASLDRIAAAIKARPEKRDHQTNAFLLAIAVNALTYQASPTVADYQLSYDAGKALVDQGIDAIEFQCVLTNYIAQDCNLFDAVDAKVYEGWRRKDAELFVRIYESARKAQDTSFDPSAPVSAGSRLTQGLQDKLIGAGVEFDSRGNPIGATLPSDLKREYDAFIAEQKAQREKREIQMDIAKLLSAPYKMVIERFFSERYGRPPANFIECEAFLSRTGVPKADKKRILCAIAREIQLAPPPDLGIECGVRTGEDEKF